MIRQELSEPSAGFDVGVCATGVSSRVLPLIHTVIAESNASEIPLRKVIVVASECPAELVFQLTCLAETDRRVDPVIEEKRRGKADAINKIISRSDSEFLLLVNSDARPAPGATLELLSLLKNEHDVGVVSARPIPDRLEGITSRLIGFMWTAHNNCSLTLNHLNLANHSSDELIGIKREALVLLPDGLVNDGAYLATKARQRGYRIRFSTKAQVHIETPSRISDIIGQRRRILFGHVDVWKRTGTMPITIESLTLISPRKGIGLLVETLGKNPQFIAIVPMAVTCELVSVALSIWDRLRSTTRHVIWKRYT